MLIIDYVYLKKYVFSSTVIILFFISLKIQNDHANWEDVLFALKAAVSIIDGDKGVVWLVVVEEVQSRVWVSKERWFFPKRRFLGLLCAQTSLENYSGPIHDSGLSMPVDFMRSFKLPGKIQEQSPYWGL